MVYTMHYRFYGTGDVDIHANSEKEAYEQFADAMKEVIETDIAQQNINGECEIEDYEITDVN